MEKENSLKKIARKPMRVDFSMAKNMVKEFQFQEMGIDTKVNFIMVKGTGREADFWTICHDIFHYLDDNDLIS